MGDAILNYIVSEHLFLNHTEKDEGVLSKKRSVIVGRKNLNKIGKDILPKEQIQHMVKVLLCLEKNPSTDAADALAIAICHANSREGLLRMQGVSGMRYGRLQ